MKSTSQYSLCISDLIIGLLFVFILILMKFMLEYQNKKETLLDPLSERVELLDRIKKDMEKEQIQIEVDQKNGVLKLNNLQYFEKGSYELSLYGKRDFKKIQKIFNRLICYSNLKNPKTQKKWKEIYSENNLNKWINYCDHSKDYRNKYGLIDSILIEGYADETPIGKNLKRKGIQTNIDLAMRRSQTVFKFLTNYKEQTKKSEEKGNYLYLLSNKQENPLFAMASYGNLRREQFLPSWKNRRIDIRFIMSQPESLKKELDYVIKKKLISKNKNKVKKT